MYQRFKPDHRVPNAPSQPDYGPLCNGGAGRSTAKSGRLGVKSRGDGQSHGTRFSRVLSLGHHDGTVRKVMEDAMLDNSAKARNPASRVAFIGGSDARIIMGSDEAALFRLWREKRCGIEPEDLSGNLIVQLGLVTEPLNRLWYEPNTGQTVECVQQRLVHPVLRWMGATLDGMVAGSGTVFEAKFMLPWSFSEEAAAEKHMAQVQHNMWVTNARGAALSIITGGGKWVEIEIAADSLYQHLLVTGAPLPLRRRSATGPHRGGAHRRYELIQCLGGFLQRLQADPRGLPRA
jgi:hypothetical protein